MPELRGPKEGFEDVLTPEALGFVEDLEREFGPRRRELLARRAERQAEIDAGGSLDFLAGTREIREGDWQVAPVPEPLQDRRVEITGPPARKMVVNALNSGARCFMADFEDANSPTWRNLVEGQRNLTDAIERTIEFDDPRTGREYRLVDEPAVLLVRPRGWHLPEKHLEVDGEPVSGSLFDFGLYAFRNAARLLESGFGPWFYVPKLQSHLEARLWNDVFTFTEERLASPHGSIKATVLVETIWAAFEMDEILWELRDHSAGLNAGRWDYQFSVVKTFRARPEFVLPDRNEVKMTAPFMRAYTELLVKTCHRRGAHAMGGMSAFVPSRKDPGRNEQALEQVAGDKRREAGDGFDGTWVAHPDSVPIAMREFDAVLGDRANQVERRRDEVEVGAGRAPRRRSHARERHRGGAAVERERRHPVHLVLAPRQRRGRDLRADGGRRHGRDRALPGVAVGARSGRSSTMGGRSPPSSFARPPSPSSIRSAARSQTTSGSTHRAGPRSRAPSSSRSPSPKTSRSS